MAHVGIRGTHVYFPEQVLDVSYLLESGRTKESVFDRIGVKTVHVAAPDETPTSMGIKAARELLTRLEIDPGEIDLVVYVWSTMPDLVIWSPSAKLSHELGIRQAFCFEVHLGCGGVQAAFQALKGMMLNSDQWKRALVVAADIWGPFADQRTGAGLIFGDSAVAAIVEKGEDVPNRLVEFYGFTNGAYNALGHAAGMTPFAERLLEKHSHLKGPWFQMIDGSNVEQLNQENPRNYRKVADRVMERSGWQYDELSRMLFPSGRFDLMRRLSKDFGVEPERTNMQYLANQGDLGCPMPLVDLHNVLSQDGVNKGDKVLVLSAGGGISWMGLTIEV